MNSSVSENSLEDQNLHASPREAPPPTEANGVVERPRVAIARYDEFFSQRTRSNQWKKTSKGDQAKKVHRKRPVLIVRRLIDDKGQYERTVVDVMSPALREILKAFYGARINISMVDPEVSIKTLFHPRHHVQKILDEERKKNPLDENLIFDLQAMVDLINEDWGSTIREVDQFISEGQITYDFLWALFPPGCLVYRLHPQLQKSQIMRHESTFYTTVDQEQQFSLTCDIISNDGEHFGLARVSDKIKKFSGAVKIQDLNFLPLCHHPKHEDIYKAAVSRGLRFSQLEHQLFEMNCGRAFQEHQDDDEKMVVFTADAGRVMIDPKAFNDFKPNNHVNPGIVQALERRDSLTDDELSICSPVVMGYSFESSQWGGFALEDLKPVTWTKTAFDSLVLEEEKKRVVHALIQQHVESEKGFDDIISGKGKGLVGLFCGNPGCGKTLTAEAMAEAIQVPLIPLLPSDLGQSSDNVEASLLRIFEVALRWNAIVLFDEADVFLHKRTPLALQQNSLMAVFLRHLEYYQGIIILTTNMVEDFDPAFESRIHFSIHYPDLDHDSRKKIWKTFIGLLGDQASGFNEVQYSHLADYKLNGREIKNIVSVARSLAADEKTLLEDRHIELVLKSRVRWGKQLGKSALMFSKENILLAIGMATLLGIYGWRVWGSR